MFTLMQSPAYWWPVTVSQPAEDQPGVLVEATFDVQFARKTVDEQDAALADLAAQSRTDAAFVQPLVTGFRKVFGAGAAEVPFTAASFAQLLQVPGVASAIAQAYFDSHRRAAAKN